MRYRRIDLNLVAALNVLLEECNVSRAAEVLNLSQSAVSGILARLREYFGDPLLVLVGRQLQLTPLGESLRAPARRAMAQIDQLIDTQPSFDPASARTKVRIIASDYVVSTYLVDTLQRLARLAPGVEVALQPALMQAGRPTVEGSGADFVILPPHLCSPEQPSTVLFEDSYTVVAWNGNRVIGEALTLAQYQTLGHVVFHHPDVTTVQPWFEQWYANQYGLTRRIEVTVASFSLLCELVIGTDRVATVPTQLATRLAQTLPLRCLPLPMQAPKLAEMLQWQRHRHDDPALSWIRERLIEGPDDPPAG